MTTNGITAAKQFLTTHQRPTDMEGIATTEEEIFHYVKSCHPDPIPTRVIKRWINDPDVKVNRILYDLAKEGKIRKTADDKGVNPRWSLTENPANINERSGVV